MIAIARIGLEGQLVPQLFTRLVASLISAMIVLYAVPVRALAGGLQGEVAVHGKRLFREGKPWIPHGFNQIAFVAPPSVTDTKPFFKIAADNYTPAEYDEMRHAGADVVRIQIAQTGTDPKDPLYDAKFRERALDAVRAARAKGLTVILSVQDEKQTGEREPAPLPNEATQRVWREIAPVFAKDRGVLYELLNEPNLPPSAKNWADWQKAMNRTIRTVRDAGATNVVVADGLLYAERLGAARPLADPLHQVLYADHPYAHRAEDQTPEVWDRKFGDFARKAPVIVGEWNTGYYCDADTPRSVVNFLRYLQDRGIGLIVVAWDWHPANFGSAIYDFPPGRFSSFLGLKGPLSCNDHGFGLGETVKAWFKTGIPPREVK